MIHLKKDETKAMVAVHGWSGILLGLLLYAVVLTGTAAVFSHEIGTWSAGHVGSRSPFEQPIDATVRRLGALTPPRYHEGVDLFEIGDRRLGAFFHRHETTPDGELVSRGIYYQLDDKGAVARSLHGTGEEVFGPTNEDALDHFLVDTHVRLHVPDPWGLLLTGILGLAMLVAAISGLLIHRHLFKDIFTLRRRANPVWWIATGTASRAPGACPSPSSWRSPAASSPSSARSACRWSRWRRSAAMWRR